MDRVKTGILGFDDLAEGGLPRASSVLLSGPCGTGKVEFSCEFLYRNSEPSLFYSFERQEKNLEDMLSIFSWDFKEAVKQKQFNVVSSELYQFETFISDLEDNIEKAGATRAVIDSLTIIGQFFDQPFKMRKGLIELRKMLKNSDCTALLLTEVPLYSEKLSTFGLEEFVLDGTIRLDLIKKDSQFVRTISVHEMIGTDHDTSIHPYEFTKKGIKVHKVREIL